ncbi:hypothetical protein D3C87_1605590 [compost metagenome]
MTVLAGRSGFCMRCLSLLIRSWAFWAVWAVRAPWSSRVTEAISTRADSSSWLRASRAFSRRSLRSWLQLASLASYSARMRSASASLRSASARATAAACCSASSREMTSAASSLPRRRYSLAEAATTGGRPRAEAMVMALDWPGTPIKRR